MPTNEDRAMWSTWDIWDGKRETIPSFYTAKKISICTTCMNRTHDLSQTLVLNMMDNEKYPHVEFVLLNYNSQDDLHTWVQENKYLREAMETGRFVYAQTTEPKFYSMSHSRNVAYKLASGDIVTNVDADNWTFAKENGFAFRLNYLASQRPEKAVFAKGKRLMHGRVGFYRKEFIEDLGGYDESFVGYGHDDHDLMQRAMLQGYRLMWFTGDFVDRIVTPSAEKGKNMPNKNWHETEKINKAISHKNISEGKFKANEGMHWGKAHLTVNFTKEIDL